MSAGCHKVCTMADALSQSPLRGRMLTLTSCVAQALSAAEHAQRRLHNRTFSGRRVEANFFDEAAFDRQELY